MTGMLIKALLDLADERQDVELLHASGVREGPASSGSDLLVRYGMAGVDVVLALDIELDAAVAFP